MTTVPSCVVCGGGISLRKNAMPAPFLARCIWSRAAFPIDLAKPSGIYLMHEHVNYYTSESLLALMTCSGWNVLASGDYHVDGPSEGSTMGWCMARL